MIIWLASYPKSGNTWVRSFLSAYYFTEDGTFEFDLLENFKKFPSEDFIKDKLQDPGEIIRFWKPVQEQIIEKQETTFLKTHNCLMSLNGNKFTTTRFTKGVIYIIRDPRNVLTSFSNHTDTSYSEALDFMLKEDTVLFNKKTKNYNSVDFLSSWSNHYKTWLMNNPFKKKIIKYENLLEDGENEFRNLIKFVNLLKGLEDTINENKFRKALETTTFINLKKKEKEGKFKENVFSNTDNKIDFFNLGQKNNWRNLLPPDIKEKTNQVFLDDIRYFKY